ncbi:hypothetical protein [Pseudomonas siliginis]|uniref:hypothetical protein n=1 Tax=Pseudomonas siliginis TaxID=2842346 RepID=UPI002093FA8D|nr:hypothetical protein [Pseudomonas siliginis]UST77192.1 hypothetical protein NF676_00565 [Pseudomonas siliginis]
MIENYLTALFQAAFASVHYRSCKRLFSDAIYPGPSIIFSDGTLVKPEASTWSASTAEARRFLQCALRNEGLDRNLSINTRLSNSPYPIVEGESDSDIKLRLNYLNARDDLIAALRQLKDVCLVEGRDPTKSILFQSIELKRELDRVV